MQASFKRANVGNLGTEQSWDCLAGHEVTTIDCNADGVKCSTPKKGRFLPLDRTGRFRTSAMRETGSESAHHSTEL